VPALFYYDGGTKPLVNSAGDYFEGLLLDEGQQKITIESNRRLFLPRCLLRLQIP
jgi:hypothetical protein